MKRRRKTIIAGKLVKIVEYTPVFPHDTGRTRSVRQRSTREAQRALNFRTAQGRLESKLAANFGGNDYFITLTFREDLAQRFEQEIKKRSKKDLPDGALKEAARKKARKEAARCKRKYLRRLREAYRRNGFPLKWICSIEDKHGDGRTHLHGVINSTGDKTDTELICSLWDYGDVHIGRLFDAAHDSGEEFNTWYQIAAYLTKERPDWDKDTSPVGAQVYSCSRNLTPPIVLPSVWVDDVGPVQIPPDAIVIESESRTNEFGSFSYLKYLTTPIKPEQSSDSI